jgi:signal peptidase I
MLKVIKVTGTSLSPFFLPGDYVIISKKNLIHRKFHLGDFIVFNHDHFGLLIKKIQAISSDQESFEVAGSHPDSLDSSTLGVIAQGDVLGKVVWHIRNPLSNPSRKELSSK